LGAARRVLVLALGIGAGLSGRVAAQERGAIAPPASPPTLSGTPLAGERAAARAPTCWERIAGTAGTTGSAPAAPDSSDRSRRAAILARRSVLALQLRGSRPLIDGRLDDAAWCETSEAGAAPPAMATDLVEQDPHPGEPASLATEARVLFDDQALYVAVRLYDPAPDSILAPLLRRDDEGQSDWVFVEFDSRRDRRTALSFGVNPRGIQADGSFSNDRIYDGSWDGVWTAAARIDSLGWTAEFRIPVSQIPHTSAAVWGINVYRYTPHRGESSNWSPRLPTLAGVVSNFNDLVFELPPHASLPVEVVPYLSAGHARGAPAGAGGLAEGPAVLTKAGADLRASLTPDLQLSVAVHPDFGQIEADPSLVNLTAFQTFFPERRPLFVHGADALGFARPFTFATRDLSFADDVAFYSRRIGAVPGSTAPDGVLLSMPAASVVAGAAKLAGRVGTWTLGVLDAWTEGTSAAAIDAAGATISVPVSPASHYAVARVARDWRTGASAVGAFATYASRVGMTPTLAALLPRDAWLLGLDGRHRFADARYEVDGAILVSRVRGSPTALDALLRAPEHNVARPDAGYLARLRADTTGRPVAGVLADARLARVGGALTWSIGAHLISPGFDMNQAGFMRSADWILATASVQLQTFPTRGALRRLAAGSNQSGVGWSFGGERRAAALNGFVQADFANYWSATVSTAADFAVVATEYLRGGPALLLPPRVSVTATLSSDQRRATQLQLAVSGTREPGSRSESWSMAPGVDARLSPAVELALLLSVGHVTEGWQFVASSQDGAGTPHYVVGRLSQPTTSLTVRGTVALSPRLSLQLYAQPFLSAGQFVAFGEVTAPRAPRPGGRITWLSAARLTRGGATGAYTVAAGDSSRAFRFDDPSFSQRDFNANLVLRWEFRPGSTLFVVWSQARHDERLSEFSVSRDAARLFGAPPGTTIQLKISYWLAS
jgi:hypothetical protein